MNPAQRLRTMTLLLPLLKLKKLCLPAKLFLRLLKIITRWAMVPIPVIPEVLPFLKGEQMLLHP